MFLTVKQQTDQKTTEIIIYFRASSAFSAHFALGTPKFWGIECGFTVKVHWIYPSTRISHLLPVFLSRHQELSGRRRILHRFGQCRN